ncbi:unnamed protein product [Strongylus vulgaris]|uniref:Uncharacterized protein n=1 Tax=Strongylus vulgaris TaxID=40348 RepID=A0A3P7ITH2_STRVU|nr:unnamed protein product [Strongylus vulgaris]
MTARLASKRSFPRPPHAPPADSPALSIFSPIMISDDVNHGMAMSVALTSILRIGFFGVFEKQSLGGHSEIVNTAVSQTSAPAHQGITPRIQVFGRELQRQPDFDLLLAELCLDHVWTEPSKRDLRGEIANKMFLSRNVLSQDFLNFLIGSLDQLRSIRVVHTVSNITTSGTMFTLSCRDATALRVSCVVHCILQVY